MKIDLIAGARPNFVKIAAIIHAIENDKNKIDYRLIHTGQHYDEILSGSFFEDLNLPPPDINLNCGSGSQAEQTAKIMIAYEKALKTSKPDMCLVVGDVNSTFACAITAKKMQVKIAHVEAGIRSGDMNMPEEINRIVTDSISDYFFTTTPQAGLNLKKNGASKNKIHFVGNTMIDTLLRFQDQLKKPKIWDKLKLLKNNYFVITLHRPTNVDETKTLLPILEEISKTSKGLPVIFPVHPRTLKILKKTTLNYNNLHLIEPLGYLEFNYLVKNSKAVLTDSGGITEETTVMNIPCMTLRDSTERPETVNIGTNELLGTNPANIAPAMEKLFKEEWEKGEIPELWDGNAGKRIVEILNSL